MAQQRQRRGLRGSSEPAPGESRRQGRDRCHPPAISTGRGGPQVIPERSHGGHDMPRAPAPPLLGGKSPAGSISRPIRSPRRTRHRGAAPSSPIWTRTPPRQGPLASTTRRTNTTPVASRWSPSSGPRPTTRSSRRRWRRSRTSSTAGRRALIRTPATGPESCSSFRTPSSARWSTPSCRHRATTGSGCATCPGTASAAWRWSR